MIWPGFFLELYSKRKILLSLSVRNVQQQYLGSAFGFFWAFIEPFIYIGILYTVFTFGLRVVGADESMPFSVYLISGIVAWIYMSNIIGMSSNSVSQYSYLINNIGFRSSLFPLINIIGNLVPHAFFLIVAIIIAWISGFAPTIYTLQIAYYLFAMISLLLGIVWLTSSTNLFVKDVSRMMSVVVTFGFWVTPVVWSTKSIPEEFHWIISLNPANYIVRGYRESLISQVPFWSHPYETLYFWAFTIVLLYLGIKVFNKLEPHFGDVL